MESVNPPDARLLIVTNKPGNFDRFRHFIPVASVAAISDDGCSFDSLSALESALAEIKPDVVLLVNREPLQVDCLVQALRSLPTGKDAYLILGTPGDSAKAVDYSVDVDDFVELGRTEDDVIQAIRLVSARYNRFNENKQRFTEATRTAQSALESAADYGSLLHFLELSEQCLDLASLADVVVCYLNGKGLNVFFCIQSEQQDIYCPLGNASTTKKQLLEAVRKADKRIIAVDRMLGFCFEHFILLVLGSQREDAAKYGQMKDNLAQFCAIVESRIKSILVHAKINRQHEHLLDVLGLVRQISLDARATTHTIMNHFSREIELISTTFDMSDQEEAKLLELAAEVRENLDELSQTNESIEVHFHDLIGLIVSVKELLDSPPANHLPLEEGMHVELF